MIICILLITINFNFFFSGQLKPNPNPNFLFMLNKGGCNQTPNGEGTMATYTNRVMLLVRWKQSENGDSLELELDIFTSHSKDEIPLVFVNLVDGMNNIILPKI